MGDVQLCKGIKYHWKPRVKYTIYIYWSRCGQLAPAGAVKIHILKHLTASHDGKNYSLVSLWIEEEKERQPVQT